MAEADLRLQEGVLRQAREAVRFATEIVDELQREADKLNFLIDEARKLVNRYNPITLFIRNWQGDIRVASEEYIKASHRAGVSMMLNSGDPLDEYRKWLDCYGPVFGAIPRDVGQAGCFFTGKIAELKREYDRAVEDLPEFLRWVLNPAGELRRRVEENLEGDIEKAKEEILVFVTDSTTARFLLLLASPENATRGKLIETFTSDSSGKGLLTFDDVAVLVDEDLSLVGGKLTPESFWPLRHSVTLSKLSLLALDQLNQLAFDLSGRLGSPYYGASLYPDHVGNFSLLVGMVRNIDGNHQWQAYGLPWPRKNPANAASPGVLPFGYDYYRDNTKGLRFWVDPFLRERVFQALFPGSAHGVLAATPDLQPPRYGFAECRSYPFPSTQTVSGQIRTEDGTCTLISDPDEPPALSTFTDNTEYAKRFQACDPATVGGTWTIAGSHLSEGSAYAQARRIHAEFPDLAFEVWRPVPPNRYWTVMAASCATRERAREARSLLIRREIARDAYLWSPRLPWTPEDQL